MGGLCPPITVYLQSVVVSGAGERRGAYKKFPYLRIFLCPLSPCPTMIDLPIGGGLKSSEKRLSVCPNFTISPYRHLFPSHFPSFSFFCVLAFLSLASLVFAPPCSWNHVALTWDGAASDPASEYVSLYVNGRLMDKKGGQLIVGNLTGLYFCHWPFWGEKVSYFLAFWLLVRY